MNTQKHIFFDLDRTLWDFERNSKEALKLMFSEYGLDKKIKKFYSFLNTYKNTNNSLWHAYGKGKITKEFLRTERFRSTLAQFNILDDSLTAKLSDAYIKTSPRQKSIFPNALETLELLQQDGYKLHIITNGFKEAQDVKMETCGFTPFFDVIVCSEEVGQTKPAPAVFQYAMKKAGADPINSVMIGDDYVVDILGALNSGMHGIHFDPKAVSKNKRDGYRIENLDEIPAILPWVFRNFN
jgi:putative hydrolase of the HAD superfamily